MEFTDRLNPAEALRHLACTPRVLKELRRQRKITFYKVGHRSLAYDRLSLDRYLKARCISAIGEPIR